jgi:hypothetical protein
MAWDEWERLKAQAAERQSASMRIDHVAPVGVGGGTGSGDLVAHQDDLGAVGHEAYILFDKLSKEANVAVTGKSGSGSTSQAAAALKSHAFATGGALEKTAEMWTSQVKSVLQACAHISNHLDYTKNAHAGDEYHIVTSLSALDLNRAFGEGKQG